MFTKECSKFRFSDIITIVVNVALQSNFLYFERISILSGWYKAIRKKKRLDIHLPFPAENSLKKQKHGIAINYTNRIDNNNPDTFNIDI